MQLYGIPNCNTVKKARDWLTHHGIDYTFHDFKKEAPSQTDLENWASQTTWQTLLNRKGLTWRGLPDALKEATQDQASALALMQQKPTVIKRPVLIKDQHIIAVGFDEAIYRKQLIDE